MPTSSSQLDVPEFQSKVPAYMLEKLDTGERYIVNTLSVMDQRTEWVTEKLKEVWPTIQEVQSLRLWKERITGKYAIIGAILYGLLTAFAGAFAKSLLG